MPVPQVFLKTGAQAVSRFCRPARNHSATWPHLEKHLTHQWVVSTFCVLVCPRQTHKTRTKTVQVPTELPTPSEAVRWCAHAI